ncbi:hypothetical protein [Bacillus paramycoides]|nr:hypothetical protein [Bacillus paramycoides]MED1464839.1 hypothetical protein [Bacillus paramycoides]MED1493366.1 hypothetical protein [Bacillus paramycoides]
MEEFFMNKWGVGSVAFLVVAIGVGSSCGVMYLKRSKRGAISNQLK